MSATTLTSPWEFTRTPPKAAASQGERAAYWAIGTLVGLLGVAGFVNSFTATRDAVEPSFGGLAWTVPLAIDAGILAFAALDLIMTRLGMRTILVRLVGWALVLVTIYLNVADATDPVGRVAHAALPGLWAVSVEVGAHIVRHRFGLAPSRPGRSRLDRVRLSRWVLAPVSTASVRRRMVLWETSSYSEALCRERDRLLARCDLQDRYGRLAWRWKAPRRERVLHRLAELPPSSFVPDPETTGSGTPETAPVSAAALDLVPGPSPSSGAGPSGTAGGTARPSSTSSPSSSGDDLLDAARAVVRGEFGGAVPSRDRLARSLRAGGHRVGTARATTLVADLKSEATP